VSLEALRERFGQELEGRLRVHACGGLLATMLDYHLGTGGKRLRGLLPLWVCERLGGDPAAHLDLAVGLELCHNATLVHDDVQDGDEWRRGRATVMRLWGSAQAINVGAALYFEALRSLLRSPCGPRAVEVVVAAMLRVIEGQTMEFQLQLPQGTEGRLEPSLETWMRMAGGKTGALYGACLRAGAIAAGAGDARIDALGGYGEELGLLFQVQDDYLDLVGEKGRDRSGADLEEGKLSFPVVWALTHATPAASRAILGVVQAPRAKTTPEMVDRALEGLREFGALEATAAWLREARSRLEGHPEAGLLPGLVSRILEPVSAFL
jgi:geranylgeranyl pyrophosphate synthase